MISALVADMRETLFLIPAPRTLFDAVPFVLFGSVVAAFAIWRHKSQPVVQTVMLCALGVLVAAGGTGATVATQRSHDELYRAYTEGRCQVVEGHVRLEHVQAAEGHDLSDIGYVGGQSFMVPSRAPAYAQTVAHGGVLREGASVRVWLYLDSVLRIDRVPTTPTTPVATERGVP